MNEQNILNAVSIEKDVDGFHPLNIGRLAMRGREPLFVPCTPKGCIELLHRCNIDIKGKQAVVIGRSNIVGMPAALLLLVSLQVFCVFVSVFIWPPLPPPPPLFFLLLLYALFSLLTLNLCMF